MSAATASRPPRTPPGPRDQRPPRPEPRAPAGAPRGARRQQPARSGLGRGIVLAVSVVLASAPLSLLFLGSTWWVLMSGAAVAVIGAGVLLRALLRRAVLVPLGQAIAVVLLVLLVEAVTGTLPGGGVVGTVTGQPDLIVAGIRELGEGRAPVTLAGPGTVVITLLLALVVFALDLLFMDLDLVTPTAVVLACFVLASALMAPDGGPWWTVAGPVAGSLLVMGSRSLLRLPRALVVCAVAVVVLVAGPALAAVLPARDPAPYPLSIETLNRLTGQTADLGPVMIDDSVSVRRDLLQGQETEVLRLRSDSPDPGYLRLTTLNAYEDGNFTSRFAAGAEESFSDRIQEPDRPEGLSDYEISVTDLRSRTLPAPPNIRWTDAASSFRLEDGRDISGELEIEGRDRILSGVTYTVASEEPTYTEDDLRAVPQDAQSGPFTSGYIRADVPPLVSTLAQEIRDDSGAWNAFDLGRAYEQYFQTNFDYDLEARSEPGVDPVTSFLQDRSGYCEQFAATFALMMDSQGYPTRVAIGFTAGTVDGDERIVTNHNAHAWPEVWFGPEMGWVRFEPTPAAAANGVAEPTFATAAPEPTDPGEPSAEPTQEPSTPDATAPAQGASDAEVTTDAAAGSTDAGGRSASSAAPAVIGVLGAAALLILAVGLTLRHRRRARALRWEGFGTDRAAAALLGWTELTAAADARARHDALRARILPRRAARTFRGLDASLPPREALTALLRDLGEDRVPVTETDRAAAARTGEAVARARYAPSTTGDSREVREDVETLRALLRRRPRRA